MDDRVSHGGIVDVPVAGPAPSVQGAGEIGKDADDVEGVGVFEIESLGIVDFTPEDQMQKRIFGFTHVDYLSVHMLVFRGPYPAVGRAAPKP